MQEIVLEERDFASPADMHALLANQLDAPDYYGQNLSALWDCLGNLSDPVRFIVRRADENQRHEWFDRLLAVLQRADDHFEPVETVIHAPAD